MKVDGRCHCGQITFEAEIDPDKVLICHCTDCQELSGSAFRIVVRAPAASFKVLTGEPRPYVKQADSGNRMIQAFCPDCGGPVYGAHTGDHTSYYGIRVSTLRQRDELAPKLQIWKRSAFSWVERIDALPSIEQHG
jgi:hypothetical protein